MLSKMSDQHRKSVLLRRLNILSNHVVPHGQQHSEGLLSRNNVCGIIAFIGEEPAINYLLEGLKVMESRGYDSAGIATISPETKTLITTKFASVGKTSNAISLLEQHATKHDAHTIGVIPPPLSIQSHRIHLASRLTSFIHRYRAH